MNLWNLTWEEVARLDRRMAVLAPFGAVEQHSLHLPLGTDSIIGEAIAMRLDAKLPGQVLLLPMIWRFSQAICSSIVRTPLCSRHVLTAPTPARAQVEASGTQQGHARSRCKSDHPRSEALCSPQLLGLKLLKQPVVFKALTHRFKANGAE
jgi:hypothetical protein